MSDYTSVGPPTSNKATPPNANFADALQRARQIAAKINTPNGSSSLPVVGGGTKRPVDESPLGMDWGEQALPKKRPAMADPMGGPPAPLAGGMPPQHRLGVPANMMVTEQLKIPNKMVGLIIGTGGEQIMGLQAVCNCKIQMEPAGAGQAERTCTLTGGQVAINKAKEMITDIISRSGTFPDRSATVEMSIPAMKVGLIIGKGGETIKSLQERAGVKMVLIQDGMNSPEKTLSIKGDPQKAEYARQLILEMLTDREMSERGDRGFGGPRGPRGQTNGYGSMQTTTTEIGVPVQAVGVVIGKGGEMIKKIQQDSGARLQFQQEDGPGERMCLLTGTQDQIQEAQSIIHELITSVLQRDQNMGRGRGRGRPPMGGGFDDRRVGGMGGVGMGPGGMMGGRGGGGGGAMQSQVTYAVPANKCGIVIGKGGETIRNINQVTGAHVQLSRDAPLSEDEKVFVIRGMPEQIEHAKQLINEKVGTGGGPPSAYSHQPMGYSQSSHQPSSDPHGYQQWQAQQGQSNNDAKQVADAWTAYYAQYYNQSQQAAQATPGQPPQPHSAQPAAQPAGQPATSGAGGVQQDYSAAWAEYYRSMGMYREAEMIEQQSKGGAQGAAPATAQPAAQAGQAGAPAVAQQPQYDQYGQYDQSGAYSYHNYGAYPAQQ